MIDQMRNEQDNNTYKRNIKERAEPKKAAEQAERKGKRKLDPVEMGRRIRTIRKSRDMTISQLAELAQTSTQFLAKVEKGEQSMTTNKFSSLVLALGVTSDFLLFGDEQSLLRTQIAAEYLGSLSPQEQCLLVSVLHSFLDTLEQMKQDNKSCNPCSGHSS